MNPKMEIISTFTGSDHFPIRIWFDIVKENMLEDSRNINIERDKEIEKEIPIVKITKDKQKLDKSVMILEDRLEKLIPIYTNKQSDCNNIYNLILWNMYDVFGRIGAFKLQNRNNIMDNGKQLDDKIRSIISLINICMEHNGHINLLNKYMEEYEKKIKGNNEERCSKNNKQTKKKYFEQVRNLLPTAEITLQDDNGKIVECDSDKYKLLTGHYKQLFKEDENNDRWTNEIEDKVKSYIINNVNWNVNMDKGFELEELQKVIGEMPNNKAVFLDQMSNEWIKSLMEISPTTTTNLFNLFV
ncbi:hypothetical protein RFI_05936 [Reticulomyxa filosa]|uniref:Uncharacterized protein n=1 Tax=Reticulomyxa filosa TaxID=46433 RepID=X6NZB6_RETFI|nr:hypothetical protein RFI_05936 [Reticulomyxa filosa]|eukprot:ETO31184.1 hypothetical protein RFI_05936 [Reticulomyxa filosa]